MHLSIFGLNYAIWFSNVTFENKVKVSKTLSAFCPVHVLDSCNLGQNQLIQSEDNVHLSIFALILAVFILM